MLIAVCVHACVVNKDEHSCTGAGGRGYSWSICLGFVSRICCQFASWSLQLHRAWCWSWFRRLESRGMLSARSRLGNSGREGAQLLVWLLSREEFANVSSTTRAALPFRNGPCCFAYSDAKIKYAGQWMAPDVFLISFGTFKTKGPFSVMLALSTEAWLWYGAGFSADVSRVTALHNSKASTTWFCENQ